MRLFNAAIAKAIEREGHEVATWNAAKNELAEASEQLLAAYPDLTREIADARDLALAAEKDPQLYGPELHMHDQAGFVRVAFRLAFWEMLHAPTFTEALIDPVNRGSDADTNAAIAGALYGVVAGEEEIPAVWKKAVLGALQDDPETPLATLYRPRVLTDLVASMRDKVLEKPSGENTW